MSFNLIAPAPQGRPGLRSTEAALDNHTADVRKTTTMNATMNAQYRHVQELQRERLRQAEAQRLRRTAYRARRGLAARLLGNAK